MLPRDRDKLVRPEGGHDAPRALVNDGPELSQQRVCELSFWTRESC